MSDLSLHRHCAPADPVRWLSHLVRRGRIQLMSTPIRAAARLAWRLITARMLSSLGALLAAALYGPQAFAFMGLYLASVKLLSLVLFLRYESAVLADENERETLAAVRLCLVVATTIGVICVPLLVLGAHLDLVPPIFVPLLMISVGARGLLRLGGILANRRGDFGTIGRATTVQAVVQPLVLLVVSQSPLHGATVMALCDIAGYGAAALVTIAPQRRVLVAALIAPIGFGELRALAHRWSCLPLLNLPGVLFSAAFTALPLIALPFLADHETAGYAALAVRILEIPAHLAGAATTPILLHRLGAGDFAGRRAFASRTVTALIVVASAIFGGALVLSYAIDPFLAATHWHGLAEMIPVFAVFYAGVTLAGPLTELGGLFREQRLLAAINGVALAAAVLAFAISGAVGPTLAAVAGLSLMRAGLLGYCTIDLAGRGNRSLRGREAAGPVSGAPMSSPVICAAPVL